MAAEKKKEVPVVDGRGDEKSKKFGMKTDKKVDDENELSVHMQLEYKQGIEIAQEEAINNVMAKNKYE